MSLPLSLIAVACGVKTGMGGGREKPQCSFVMWSGVSLERAWRN